MLMKKILAFLAMWYAVAAMAAVDVNKATAAELEGVKGIGPAISGKIIEERKKGNFKDWNDLIERVKGVGEGSAAKLSAGGLTVGGAAYKAAAAAPAAKDEKKAAKPEAKAKADDSKAKAEADGKAKEAAKAKADSDQKAKEDAKKKADDEAKSKKDESKKKADAAKPAASAAKK